VIRLARNSSVFLLLLALGVLPASGQTTAPPLSVRYTVSLARAADHLVEIEMDLPPGAPERDIQLPVWNAIYQVRDFSQFVNWLRAEAPDGRSLPVLKLDKTTWRVIGAGNGVRVRYEIFADQAGPFGAQLNEEHAFFNLAQILTYPVDGKQLGDIVRFVDIPPGWRIATSLRGLSSSEFEAAGYDRLVDSPVEIGNFRETSFKEEGTRYRIVVDGNSSDYDLSRIAGILRRIVAAETSWMRDRPSPGYVFIYHFPRGPAGGGMEHAYSTAIDVSANRVQENPESIAAVTAHEFFHLWNVKRIRPRSLEPIDYTRENYTTALWFSEGFTSTAGEYARLRSGLLDEGEFLRELSSQIRELQRRPAHRTQSAEQSSLDTWLEKYDYYRLPERSISYYNKGFLLGVLLDLQLREVSGGRASLRDLFLWMNEHYAKSGHFFPDSAGVREAAEAVSHGDLQSFFDKYVAGTEELPYDDVFRTVGLRVVETTGIVPDLGFTLVRGYGTSPVVARLVKDSAAAEAGIKIGDILLAINGEPLERDLEDQIATLRPGDTVRVTLRRRTGEKTLAWKLGGREELQYAVRDLPNVTPQQRARRKAWLAGEDQSGEAARP
jgi:predicted metalloprotease with PDZ domain